MVFNYCAGLTLSRVSTSSSFYCGTRLGTIKSGKCSPTTARDLISTFCIGVSSFSFSNARTLGSDTVCPPVNLLPSAGYSVTATRASWYK